MNIGEKLDELRNGVLRDTSDLVAGDADSLWTDAQLLRFLKDGERRFARQALVIRDFDTPQVTQVRLKTGVGTYRLHPSVVAVLSARYDTDTYDLASTGHAIIRQVAPPEQVYFDPSLLNVSTPGRPRAYFTDETLVLAGVQSVSLTVDPVPDVTVEGKIVHLRVCRLPLCKYTMSDLELESEIPEDYELDPLFWAAYRAMGGSADGDVGLPVNAAGFKQRFDDAVQEALREIRRKLGFGMSFRFGMGGFSYTR